MVQQQRALPGGGRASLPRRANRQRGQTASDPSPQQAATGAPTFSSSATLNAQFWLEQFPWRPTAAWAVLAALVAIGASPLTLEWRTVLLLLLLVDPLWGSIWRLAAGRNELLPLQTNVAPRPVWLPYLVPESPAARLLDWNQVRALPLLFRVGLPSLLLAAAVALVLTPAALWMTASVFLLSVVGWIVRRSLQRPTPLLHSVVTITLPWLLALNLFGTALTERERAIQLALIGFWTIHNWGEGRNLRAGVDLVGLLLLAVAEVGMVSLLIFLRAPFWLALLVVLWLPTWVAIYYRRQIQHLNFLWLLAMLLSAWALGQNL